MFNDLTTNDNLHYCSKELFIVTIKIKKFHVCKLFLKEIKIQQIYSEGKKQM